MSGLKPKEICPYNLGIKGDSCGWARLQESKIDCSPAYFSEMSVCSNARKSFKVKGNRQNTNITMPFGRLKKNKEIIYCSVCHTPLRKTNIQPNQIKKKPVCDPCYNTYCEGGEGAIFNNRIGNFLTF